MIGKILLGLGGSVALAGAWMASEGLIRVEVDYGAPGEAAKHTRIYVPAALAPLAVRLAPKDKLRNATRQAREWLPAAQIATTELARLPDFDLVEVRNSHEHVRIYTRGGRLYIESEQSGESVHVSAPLRTLRAIAEELNASTEKQ